MQRVSELQRDGMWTDRRLPKCQEPQRPKAHWDYVLEEMVWLASDFAQERKWKKAAAKRCSRMVLKYFADRAQQAQRAERSHELQLRRIAAAQAKEIKLFWSNVEKLVEHKQNTHIKEKRKQAMDQHLSFIVDQTERFSKQLAVGMNKAAAAAASASASASASAAGSRVPSVHSGDDDEFSPGGASSGDDEETIARAEREMRRHDVKDEIAALQKESQMDLDEFLSELPANYLREREKLILDESRQASADESDDDDDDDNDEDNEDEDNDDDQDNDVYDDAEDQDMESSAAAEEKAKKSSPTTPTPVESSRTMRASTRRSLRGTDGTVTSATSASEKLAAADDADDDDGEYSAKEQSDDDEDTIREQEATEAVDHQKEIDELNVSNRARNAFLYFKISIFLYAFYCRPKTI